MRAELAARMAGFDDAALEALANRGLLRRARKDLERAVPEVVEETADAVVVAVGGHRVRLDAKGPAGAACDCPATSVCQHVLAAVLALAADAGDAQATGDPAAELAAIPDEVLLAHAGRAGYRWAWQTVEDLFADDGIQVETGPAVGIRFARPPMAFHYGGGPIDALIVDHPPREIERYRVAAVLAWRRATGQAGPVPEPVRGKAPDTATEQQASRQRLRAAVLVLAEECLQLGLSHLSADARQGFATLATWAQGAEYHRLALTLRRLADHVDLLLERNAAADEHRLFDDLVTTVALVRALAAAEAAGTAPVSLVGRARGTFDPAAGLELIGLGARPWRSASGFTGLTVLFRVPATNSFVTWTDARPDSQRFDAEGRYRAGGPWTGLTSPAAATGRRVRLLGAQLSDAGRLSGSERTAATVGQRLTPTELAESLSPRTDWAELLAERSGHTILASRRPVDDWVILAPAGFGEPEFDPSRQVLVWPLADAAGRWCVAEVPYGRFTGPVIDRIEQLASDGIPPGTLLVAQVRHRHGGLIADPFTLVHAGPDAPATVEPLAYPAVPVTAAPRPEATRASTEDEPVTAVPQPLRHVRTWTERTAERGVSPASAGTRLAELAVLADRAAHAGFTTFQALATPSGTENLVHRAVDALVRAHLLCLQHELLLTGGDR